MEFKHSLAGRSDVPFPASSLAEIPSCLSQHRENGASVKVNFISILFTTTKTRCWIYLGTELWF